MEYSESTRHILIKLTNCDSTILNDSKSLDIYMREAAKELNLGRIINSFFAYNLTGITIVILLNKCQIILNSNTKTNVVTVDLFTVYLNANLYSAFDYLYKTLNASNCIIKEVLSNNSTVSFPQFVKEYEFTNNFRMKSELQRHNITILGSSGGVAKSVLSILNRACEDSNDPIHQYIKGANIYLVDLKQKNPKYYFSRFANLKDKIHLYQFNVNNLSRLKSHLKETNTSIVLDISFGDTVNMLKCCNSLGIVYINSALESISVDENENYVGFPLQHRYMIFESHRNNFKNTTAIVCSGMNPGVVQWMAIELMRKYPNNKPKGCYIIENDTSFFEDENLADKNTIYTTWYPEGFLDEAINSYPTFMKKHTPLFMYKAVYDLEFKVTLGEKHFFGALMPHEEAITLGKMFDIETGFIYKINDHTTNLIKSNLKNVNSLWKKPMKVLDPEISPLRGEDLVGILLVFDNFEAYMYNPQDNNETYEKYKTSATYHQVAAGIYGALATILLDEISQGIYYVDELITNTHSNYGKYLSYHLEKFMFGENKYSDGNLTNRMKKIT